MTSVIQKEVSCRERERETEQRTQETHKFLASSCLFESRETETFLGMHHAFFFDRISSSLTFLDLRLQLMSSSASFFSGEDVNVIMNRNTIVSSRLMYLLLWYSSSLHEEGSQERCVSLSLSLWPESYYT